MALNSSDDSGPISHLTFRRTRGNISGGGLISSGLDLESCSSVQFVYPVGVQASDHTIGSIDKALSSSDGDSQDEKSRFQVEQV